LFNGNLGEDARRVLQVDARFCFSRAISERSRSSGDANLRSMSVKAAFATVLEYLSASFAQGRIVSSVSSLEWM